MKLTSNISLCKKVQEIDTFFTMKWELEGKNKFSVFLSNVLSELCESRGRIWFTQSY